jgi:predicted transcriptional regulator
MLDETVTLRLPEELHHRLASAAAATRRSLEEILLHALRIGSPPSWDDAPPEHQAELAAMDRLDDDALWKLARGRRSETEMVRHGELLEQSVAGALGDAEHSELEMLRHEADRFMLIKAHATVLLRWRGHDVPVR